MKRTPDHINVFIWGQLVGAVALEPTLGYYVFAYDKKFGASGIDLSPLHMPLNNYEQPYIFPNLPELTYKRLPAMLADSLPDDFGNALIDRYMASKGITHSQITTLDRLAYMGDRAMGALEFKPAAGPRSHISTALEMNNLVTEARNIIQGNITDHNELTTALRNIIDVGTSAGGARAKAVIAWEPNSNEIRSGQLAPAYDLTFAYNPKGECTNQHLMSVNNKFHDITRQDLLSLADQFAIGNAPEIINDVQRVIREWPIFAVQAGVTGAIIDKIRLLHCTEI
jgi:hypothetical protein